MWLIELQGESIPAAFESILRSSHLNVTRNIHNAMGSQILLQSAIWGRLGKTPVINMNSHRRLTDQCRNILPVVDEL